MIIKDRKITVKWNAANKKHFESIVDENGNQKYKWTKRGDEFLVDFNDLNKGSTAKVPCKCDYCEEEYEGQYNDVIKNKNQYCSKACKSLSQQIGNETDQLEFIHHCSNCNEEVKLPNYRHLKVLSGEQKNVFCSKSCGYEWQSKNQTGENNHNYNSIKKKCLTCSEEYEVPFGQKDRSKYCSVECRQKGQQKRTKMNCLNCDKEIYKTPTDIKKNKSGEFFCSHECSHEYRSKKAHETRNCEICKEPYVVKKKSNQRFCSPECQHVWQAEYLVGENASGYFHSISKEERTHNCDWCGEETEIKPYQIKQKQEGKKIFCSKKCYREWYAKDWSQQEEWKDESRIRAVQMISDGLFGTDTTPQLAVNKILDDLNIKYTNEYNCKYFAMDNYLDDYNLMIEVMGTYWHADHRVYKEINYQRQVDRIKNDKAKHTYIKNNYDVEILYLWEEDINNNESLIKELINLYISNNGKLEDYHSFNYSLIDNKITLNNNIEYPYMTYEIDNLRDIIKLGNKGRSMKQPDKWLTFNCESCGEEKEQLISHYNNSKTHCCSRKCAYELKKKLNKHKK